MSNRFFYTACGLLAALLIFFTAGSFLLLSDGKSEGTEESPDTAGCAVTENAAASEENVETEEIAAAPGTEEAEASDNASADTGASVTETENAEQTVSRSNGILNTGNLTETGRGYEGTEGTGEYNYGEALQMALLFYELQRSGDIPEETRCNWRGDSGMTDGADNGVDLTGGWYDAGDNMKFNLPMAYSAAMLGWSVYEDYEAYQESGQLSYALSNIRWANDYFIKCHTADYEYYYQVGDGGLDHGWWGPAETMSMNRPSYKVTLTHPGSSVVAEAAASLAVCSICFKTEDPEYSETCLSHARKLYEFAETTASDAGYIEDGVALAYYNINSGCEDEISWAATWLYLATGEEAYLADAEEHIEKANQDYNWAHCWDDVHDGTRLLLARITGKEQHKEKIEANLDWWTVGYDGTRVTYTPKGLAWLDSWGSLRYATTQAFLAYLYAEYEGCSSDKADIYIEFAESQINYALGSTGRSFVCGFGENYPVNPHHRTAQGSYSDNMNEPSVARHTLYGALVGGPDSNDGYEDTVSNYTCNEVACDYNAGFVGILAHMYGIYHGETRKDFGAVEPVGEDELAVEACVNVSDKDLIELRAFVYNRTAWPARMTDGLKLRYFMDLTEVYDSGRTAKDLVVSTNYMEAGSASGLLPWDEEANIWYVEIDFTGDDIRPGGQSSYKKEVQFRIRNAEGSWDNTNDPSYECLSGNNGSTLVPAVTFALYDNGTLVYGTEP